MRSLSLVLITSLGLGGLAAQEGGGAAPATEPAPAAEATMLTEAEVQQQLQPIIMQLGPAIQSGQATLEAVQEPLAQIATIQAQTTGEMHDQLAGLRAQVLIEVGAYEQAATIAEGIKNDPQGEQSRLMGFALLAEAYAPQENAEELLTGLIAEAREAQLDPGLIAHLEGKMSQLALQVGRPFPTIQATALDGTEIDTSTMDGQVYLVDFWATWCGPCIAEMPNVIAAYEEYGDQGFQVIGVSLDEDEQALRTFIEEHGMDWPQIFDGQGWQNAVAQQFGIQSIPATFLVGPDGTIVATDLRGDQLANELERLLGGGES